MLHDGSDFSGPLRIRLTSVTPRFILRYHLLQDQIARLNLISDTGQEDIAADGGETYSEGLSTPLSYIVPCTDNLTQIKLKNPPPNFQKKLAKKMLMNIPKKRRKAHRNPKKRLQKNTAKKTRQGILAMRMAIFLTSLIYLIYQRNQKPLPTKTTIVPTLMCPLKRA